MSLHQLNRSIAYPQPLPAFIRILRTPILNWIGQTLIPKALQVRSILRLVYYSSRNVPEEAVKAYTAPLLERGGYHALIYTAKQLIIPDIQNVIDAYRALHVPTLIIWGRHDRLVPLSVGERLRRVPDAQLVILECCGHAPHQEKHKETLPIITEFLRSIQS